LGAQLTRITMMSESARGDLANPGRAAAGLEKIYDTARELTRSMDEIVWAVSPRHDTLEGLATYLEKFAQDWLAGVGIRCRLDLPLQFPGMAPDFRSAAQRLSRVQGGVAQRGETFRRVGGFDPAGVERKSRLNWPSRTTGAVLPSAKK
jgi:hypothetical protein